MKIGIILCGTPRSFILPFIAAGCANVLSRDISFFSVPMRTFPSNESDLIRLLGSRFNAKVDFLKILDGLADNEGIMVRIFIKGVAALDVVRN